MYFKVSVRINAATGESDGYYRLVESYRNENNRVCHSTILNIGFMEGVSPEQKNKIQKHLTDRREGLRSMFSEEDPVVRELTEKYWKLIIEKGRVDLSGEKKQKNETRTKVYADSIRHKEARELGGEWLCYQALDQLGLPSFLSTLGWSDEQIRLACTQIISRAVYPASELCTARWIKENSAVCELTGYPADKITKDKLYEQSLKLYDIREHLEQYLSIRTNELFDLQDSIVLYDLTNTYFEGSKKHSRLARFGKSKEKRRDAKLVVLALVINPEGFLKYSNIYEGNKADASTLPDIISTVRKITSGDGDHKGIVIVDAGIASEENLALLEGHGLRYVCVSRRQLKDYEAVIGSQPQTMITKNKTQLVLQRVATPGGKDYFLRVQSEAKQATESSMLGLFHSRFETELKKAQNGIDSRHGIKQMEKVQRRIGRAIEKYRSVARFYDIAIEPGKDGNATAIKWSLNSLWNERQTEIGAYFVRTNIDVEQEQTLWSTYNIIREVEATMRTLKTDLDLRPIYHQSDKSTMAHLHLGLLAYWLVNTIRYQAKRSGITHGWKEILRISQTQKLVTTTAQNTADQLILIKKSTEPNENLLEIYKSLKYKPYPFAKRKFVVHKPELKKIETPSTGEYSPP